MEPYLYSTYTPSCRRQGKLPFLSFTSAMPTLSEGPTVEAWELSNEALILTLYFFKFFILCIEICHGKIPRVYQFNLKACQAPLCLRHTQQHKFSPSIHNSLTAVITNSYMFRQSVCFRKVEQESYMAKGCIREGESNENLQCFFIS